MQIGLGFVPLTEVGIVDLPKVDDRCRSFGKALE